MHKTVMKIISFKTMHKLSECTDSGIDSILALSLSWVYMYIGVFVCINTSIYSYIIWFAHLINITFNSPSVIKKHKHKIDRVILAQPHWERNYVFILYWIKIWLTKANLPIHFGVGNDLAIAHFLNLSEDH